MKIVSSNWKMNGSLNQIREYFKYFLSDRIDKENKIIFCIPYVFLQEAVSVVNNYPNIEIFAQNVHHEESGSFTGEISAHMLKSIGALGSLVGHSERRKIGESSEIINKKIKLLLKHNLKVIFCIGESENDNLEETLTKQISEGLKDVSIDNIIFAYEPIYSIGSDSSADISHINRASDIISDFCQKKYNQAPKIIYGGSVNDKNFEEIISQNKINGVLVGRYSLDPEQFLKLVI